ncbi:MAG: fibronectin type III domain-containing protein [Bacteroides sp.]|nr:fibronectin type III domain-containing protein [Bacteroides sp.]MCM1378513.1 fibronectin type III domain-containing protein [Bacteroides sp.]MCM1444814.1 fibronectin type III domain-containing protein [Prevotella sp.]
MAAKASSDTKAVISAEVNVSNNDEGFGFEWRGCDAPELVPSTKVACPVVGGVMSGRLSNLSANTYYQYRPYYEAADGTMYYGDWIAFGIADAYVYFEPMVNTYEPTAVTETSATLSGYALGGSDDIIEQGFEYSTGSRATGKVLADGVRMTATLTNLLPGTTYTVRAFVRDAKATTYGSTVTFTTAGEPIHNAIEEVGDDAATQQTFDVWTLQGVCVKRGATDLSGLRPGIYIVNGRKILIR